MGCRAGIRTRAGSNGENVHELAWASFDDNNECLSVENGVITAGVCRRLPLHRCIAVPQGST